jgi:hypothetical protein
MVVVAATNIVTRADMLGKPHHIQPSNPEWVTVIECMNSSGCMVPPCIIFKGKRYVESRFEEYGLPPDWRIELSANGWTYHFFQLQADANSARAVFLLWTE